jgi:hypothetical protein
VRDATRFVIAVSGGQELSAVTGLAIWALAAQA